jgi:hypothetical protein
MRKIIIIFFIVWGVLSVGAIIGAFTAQRHYNSRCMKYFGNKGYPASHYCKLFIGEVKARDEE